MIEHFPVLIIAVGLLGAFFTPIIGLIRKELCSPWASFITLLQFLISIFLLYQVLAAGNISYWLGGWQPPWGIEYAIDILNAFVLVLVAGVCFSVSIYAKKSLGFEVPGKELPLYTLYILLSTGMLGIVVTGDIFNLYVFLEIGSLAAYALIAVGDRQSLMASFNYMIMGTISASFILLGIGYLYVMTGTLNMADLSERLPELYGRPVILVALALLVVGLSIKTALFPLHTWLPDAYTHAPSAVSAMLAGTFTKVGIYALIRVMFTVISPEYVIETVPVMNILSWVAAAGIVAGSVLAIAQYDIKRMLAYSSVSQIGYIILGVSMANKLAMTGGILHILSHSLMKVGLFMVAGAIIYRTGIRNIYQLKGMGKKMPFTMAAFVIGALSMIGIPPTIGFASKFYLAWGALEAENWVFVAVILLSSLLTAVYFWRIFENVYFGVHEHEEIKKDEVPLSMLLPILIFAAITLLLGLFASLPIGVIEHWVTGVLP
ncbi:MAG: monovalent cation/H+ antiporter subunit D family protein [Candidatus Methanoperedens sp.]|nr:monovalent cation/H+ antiporter subunit D family protein [Candidatus Methanoperedens sp.]